MIAELADPCTYLGDIFDPADAKPCYSTLTPIINLANQGITVAAQHEYETKLLWNTTHHAAT